MPTTVFENLIPNRTPLEAGRRHQSSVVQVDGAREVNLILSITQRDASVQWSVLFGPGPNNGYSPVRTGTFATTNHAAISVPVYGTRLFVTITNQGSTNHHTSGTYYLIREDGPPQAPARVLKK